MSVKPELLADDYREMRSFAAVGRKHGITGAAVRQSLLRNFPGLVEEVRAIGGGPDPSQICVIPKCENAARKGTKTCSVEHSELWSRFRYRLDPVEHQKQRIRQARAIMAHPEKYQPSRLAWAQAMLSDNPPPPNRRFRRPVAELS